VLLLGAFGPSALPAAAAEETAPPVVPLDRLLQLPPSAPVQGEIEKHGGSSRGEWLARFQEARSELEDARLTLEEAREALEEEAGGESWQMGAPGLGNPSPTDTPVDYKRSQDMKRRREDVQRAERRLRDLEVEANLAGVPEDWRRPVEPAAPAADPPS
jgi:hypothetical protein